MSRLDHYKGVEVMKRQSINAILFSLIIVLVVITFAVSSPDKNTTEQPQEALATVEEQLASVSKHLEEVEGKLADLTKYIDQMPGFYVGAKGREPFHLLFCDWAKKISPRNRMFYLTHTEAVADGRRGCKVCRP